MLKYYTLYPTRYTLIGFASKGFMQKQDDSIFFKTFQETKKPSEFSVFLTKINKIVPSYIIFRFCTDHFVFKLILI